MTRAIIRPGADFSPGGDRQSRLRPSVCGLRRGGRRVEKTGPPRKDKDFTRAARNKRARARLTDIKVWRAVGRSGGNQRRSGGASAGAWRVDMMRCNQPSDGDNKTWSPGGRGRTAIGGRGAAPAARHTPFLGRPLNDAGAAASALLAQLN